MRIGIMGAKGDPWHFLHFLIAEQARVQRGLDKVFMVTAGVPVDKTDVTDKEIRHQTLTNVLGDDQYLIPSRVEIDRDGPSFMADTLRHFKKLFGDDVEIDLIIGEDRAPTIKNWHEPQAICQLATIVVAPRMNAQVDKDWLKSVLPDGARFETIELEFSSSFIRKQIQMGRTVRWLVPEAGIAVLDEHKPYAPKPQPASAGQRSTKMRIKSILDNDLYKFSMLNALLRKFANIRVGSKFTDRKAKGKWTPEALQVLKDAIAQMAELKLTDEERAYCEKTMPWINRSFWDFLANFRFNPAEVKVWLDSKNNLQIEIEGLWCNTILWEVPLLALVSEIYFEMIDTDWNEDGQFELMEGKAKKLFDAGVLWGDFGTRRRRNFEAQERVVIAGKKYKNFTGTSNVYLAMKHGVKALGTMAHEWIMAHSALYGLRHANKFALENWNEVYQGRLGTALPDTFGTDAFLRDFQGVLARLFDSVRHDSGPWKEWALKMKAHYESLNIDWRTKSLGFTDGNTADSAIEIHNWVKEMGGQCWFGIGTSMSNDYEGSPALSIVIKLSWVEDESGIKIHVVKLSDTPEKATGDADAVRVAKWTHMGIPLDPPDPVEEVAVAVAPPAAVTTGDTTGAAK